MQSPTAITDDTVWLRSRDVSDAPEIGGEQYYETHDVTRRENATAEDMPPVDDSLCPVADEQEREAVRDIDREALEAEKLIGKWQLTGSKERIEELWPALLADAETGILWAVKAMTATGYAELPYDDYMIVVYTPNYFETDDVVRVRKHLRDEHGVTHELYYKPDIYTAKGIVAETTEEFGLSVPARYVA